MKPAGPRGMVCVTPFIALWIVHGPSEGLHRTQGDHHDPGQEGDREQDVEACSG